MPWRVLRDKNKPGLTWPPLRRRRPSLLRDELDRTRPAWDELAELEDVLEDGELPALSEDAYRQELELNELLRRPNNGPPRRPSAVSAALLLSVLPGEPQSVPFCHQDDGRSTEYDRVATIDVLNPG